MKLLQFVLFLFSILLSAESIRFAEILPKGGETNCINFTVGQGTGCDWMCNYCANQLGTNNYYFTDGVCTYSQGGCVGNPISGKQYTCCSVEINEDLRELFAYNPEL